MAPKRKRTIKKKKSALVTDPECTIKSQDNIEKTQPDVGVQQRKCDANLLKNALKNHDIKKIHSLLRINDEQSIIKCLTLLPVSCLATLTEELNRLIQRGRPNDMDVALRWFRLLTEVHEREVVKSSCYGLRECLETSLGVLDQHIDNLKDIFRISGQLDLVISQMRRNMEDGVNNNENALIIKDDDDDDLIFPCEDACDKWSDEEDITSTGTRSLDGDNDKMDISS